MVAEVQQSNTANVPHISGASKMEITRKLFRMPELESIVGIKQTKIYESIKEGTFPPPVRIGVKVVAWNSVDVDRWIGEQIQNTENIAPYKWNGAGKVSKEGSDVKLSAAQGGKL